MEKKPGYRTSEFWLTLAAILVGAFLASGVTDNDIVLKVVGMVATILGALGYQVTRYNVKGQDRQAEIALWNSRGVKVK